MGQGIIEFSYQRIRHTVLSPEIKRKYVNGDDENDFEKVVAEVGSSTKVPYTSVPAKLSVEVCHVEPDFTLLTKLQASAQVEEEVSGRMFKA